MMKAFGYTTTAFVVAMIILMILWTASGRATLDQCVGSISYLIGIWLLPLLCVIVNKVRGKPAGGLTLVITCLSWLAFSSSVIGPFVGGLVRGYTAAAALGGG
jgi:purine-cytosine permease-like protein